MRLCRFPDCARPVRRLLSTRAHYCEEHALIRHHLNHRASAASIDLATSGTVARRVSRLLAADDAARNRTRWRADRRVA